MGAWSGSGTAHLEGGRSERLSCKGYYSGAGAIAKNLDPVWAGQAPIEPALTGLQKAWEAELAKG